MKSNELTETHLQFIDLEKRKAEYKEFSEQLKQITEKLIDENGVGHTFQDADGIVYKTVVPEGTFVQFKRFDVVRTRREGEVKGSLSMKEAKECGFELDK